MLIRHLVNVDRLLSSLVGRPSGYRDEECVSEVTSNALADCQPAVLTPIFRQNVMMNTCLKIAMALLPLCSQLECLQECFICHAWDACKIFCP